MPALSPRSPPSPLTRYAGSRSDLYSLVVVFHSWLRWAVVVLGVVLLVRTFRGARAKRTWTAGDELAHKAFLRTVDVQFVLGVLLYAFLSPLSRAFLAQGGAAMKDATLRFFGVEHAFGMLLAIALLHIGRGRSRKADSDAIRHKRAFTFSLLGFLVILASIPWPFVKAARPLARGLGGVESAGGLSVSAPSGAGVSCPPSYKARCAACHGDQGRGDGLAAQSLRPPPRDFGERSWQASKTDERLRSVIRNGGAASGLSVAMPESADLPPAEIDALVTCVRSFQR